METNKPIAESLSEQKTTNLWAGLVFALATLYLGFEWTDRQVTIIKPQEDIPVLMLEDEMIPITEQPEQQPAAPVLVTPEIPEILNIVDNDTEMPEDQPVVQDEDAPVSYVTGPPGAVTDAGVTTVAAPGPVQVQSVAPPAAVEVKEKPAPVEMDFEEEEIQTEEQIFDTPEQMAKFPGGDEALYKYLSSHIKYPARCQEQGVQGRVFLKFVVNKDGSIQNVTVVRSPDQDLATEAVRVVKGMPKWTAAKMGNKPVRSYFTLPVNFQIK